MSSTSRMLDILDFFTESKSKISLEDVTNHLNVSIPTGYRYLKELCEFGLLAKVESNSYILGPKIIKLDYQIRKIDPTIRLGIPILKELVNLIGGEALLSSIYNDEIINIHSEKSTEFKYDLTYSRGNPHPMYKGATSKIIIANFAKNKIRKIYDQYEQSIVDEEIAPDWDTFYKKLMEFKKQEYAIAYGELDTSMIGIAAPIFVDKQIVGAITLVIPEYRLVVLNLENILQLIIISAQKLSNLLNE